MNTWLMVIIPLIGALIGWIANQMVIGMLFHPKQPVRVLGLTIQGIFPKRRLQLAQQLGKLVSSELFSFADLEEKVTHPDNFKKIMPIVETHVDEFLRSRLPKAFPMIGMFIGEKTINELKTLFMNELEVIFPVVMKGYMTNLQQQLDLEKIVAGKIATFSSDKLESVLYQTMGRELGLFKLLGGLVGFIIGVIQVLIAIAFN